jgi:hypothetical protein
MTEQKYKIGTYVLLIIALLLSILAISCRTTYRVTDHRHLPNGAYYYKLNDSIDYFTCPKKHIKCYKKLKLRRKNVKRIEIGFT